MLWVGVQLYRFYRLNVVNQVISIKGIGSSPKCILTVDQQGRCYWERLLGDFKGPGKTGDVQCFSESTPVAPVDKKNVVFN